jgi:hypothetical protein
MSTKDKELDINVDVRMAERLLKRGHLSRKEYEKVLKQLPDVKAKAASAGAAAGSRDED